jgi:type II secretory pathway component PulF
MYSLIELIRAPLDVAVANRLRAVRRATLLRTMAQAVERALPLAPFLWALADEAGGRWGRKLRLLSELLDAGTAIPQALETVPGLLPEASLGIIRVAAHSGRLAQALELCAGCLSMESDETQGANSLGLLIYLAIVVPLLLSSVSFVSYWIIPKYRLIFDGFGLEFPAATQSMVRVSELFVDYSFLFPLAFVAVLLLVFLDRVFGIPVLFSPIALLKLRHPRSMMPMTLRALSFAVEGGRPIDRALTTLALNTKAVVERLRLAKAASAASSGNDCWRTLHELRIVRKGEQALLAAGERVGNLPWVLRCLADAADRQRRLRTAAICEALRLLAIVSVGVSVCWFAMALFMPLITVIEDLS